MNNGTCIDRINSFLCICPSGYTGLRCETVISQCLSLPCLNGGTCRDLSTGTGAAYICICLPFYTGVRCEQPINACASSPCVRGTCIPTIRNGTSLPAYFCQCISGFTGLNCDIPIDQCTSSPCGPFGTCITLGTIYRCCCAPGYTGVQCDQTINLCATNPCSTDGTLQCVSTGAGIFTCLCRGGYSGRYCETNINECLSQPVLLVDYSLREYSDVLFSVSTEVFASTWLMVIDATVRPVPVEVIVHVYKNNVQEWNVSTEADASPMEHA